MGELGKKSTEKLNNYLCTLFSQKRKRQRLYLLRLLKADQAKCCLDSETNIPAAYGAKASNIFAAAFHSAQRDRLFVHHYKQQQSLRF